MEPPPQPRLEVGIYQISDDATFKKNRTDGTGFEWGWADVHRAWMDATSHKFAYRCLPLTIANQTGWWVRNPVGFTALWHGAPDRVDITFDAAADFWKTWVTNHFGNGILTWNTPFLFRTRPPGSRLLVMGPPNQLKDNAQPLTGLIESDWISMSFTMNWKIMRPKEPVRFEMGEPIFQAIPVARNICLDLEEADVVYRKLDDDPEIAKSYRDWVASRQSFHERQSKGEFGPEDWQKHYFRGLKLTGEEAPTVHFTKVKPPTVRFEQGKLVVPAAAAPDVPPTARPEAPKPQGAPSRPPGDAIRPDPPRPTPDPVAAFGGLRLRSWRLHPRAARLAPAAAPGGAGPALGWHVYAPLDMDVIWYGGRSFDWKALTAYGDEDAETIAAVLARAGGNGAPGYQPPRKLDFGGAGEGVVTIWTGLLLQSPPGWALEVRPLAGDLASPLFAAEPEVLAADAGPTDLALRLRFRLTDRWAHIRGTDPAVAQPIGHLVPIRREGFEAQWLLGQMPIEASKDAAEVVRRWAAARA